jgi:hypothetical protein
VVESAIRSEINKGIQITKEDIKLLLFADLIVNIENTDDFMKNFSN